MARYTTGELLALLRKSRGFTQQEIAKRLNVSDKTISSWENDRTIPDIYTLPAIAELYGVTVDEILRGERQKNDIDIPELTENAQRGIRKRRYCSFALICNLLAGIAVIGAITFVIACVCLLYTPAPFLFDIILGILGILCVLICIVLTHYFQYKTRVAEGVVLDDDYTDEQKNFALALKNKSTLTYNLPAIVFLLTLIIFGIAYSGYDFTQKFTIIIGGSEITVQIIPYFAGVMCTNGIAAVALFISSFIYRQQAFKEFSTAEIALIRKDNFKLFTKVYLFGLIAPVVAAVSLIIYACVCGATEKFFDAFYLLFLWVSLAASAFVCSVIFAVKRKKINYRF